MTSDIYSQLIMGVTVDHCPSAVVVDQNSRMTPDQCWIDCA